MENLNDNIEDIDDLKNRTLDYAESLLSKIENITKDKSVKPPMFTKEEVDSLKTLIEFHN
jgi:hypothetical protein